ncbi:hypothetical protein [Kibdelosporangium phytohabitans]|uniref:hypothetical protein n=1 Tax=Kibdelosporangium phytohabitans TaxID=860235 RepID=UPI0014706EDF|nr:hypothetical protein [Kibdelosporangium phytohabitans]MBE1461382.1 integrase [Kibdelosporangium phytohabitans]
MLIWLAIITGARRGELCALRSTDFHSNRRVLHITRSIPLDGAQPIKKETKGPQRRHIALTPTPPHYSSPTTNTDNYSPHAPE